MIQFWIILFKLAEAKNPLVSYNNVDHYSNGKCKYLTVPDKLDQKCQLCWSLDSQLSFPMILFLQSLLFRWEVFSFCCLCAGWMYIRTSGKWLCATGTKSWRKLVSKQSSILFQLRADEHSSTWKKPCCYGKLSLPRVNHDLFVYLNWQKVRSEANLVSSIIQSLRPTTAFFLS